MYLETNGPNFNTMTHQTTGRTRDTLDKFYTSATIAKMCVDLWFSHISPQKVDAVCEPSAGSGAFVAQLENRMRLWHIIALDISPAIAPQCHTHIQGCDFLSTRWNTAKGPCKYHFIGNPPFGRQASIARKFIKHITSCDRAQSVSFILPKSFKKLSMQKVFPLKWGLIASMDIPKGAFLLNGEPYHVPTVFQIWVKGETDRDIPLQEDPKDFSFVKKDQNPDIAIRRVGVNAGRVSDEPSNLSEQSHYFIKLNEGVDKKQFLAHAKAGSYPTATDTTGPKSITKQDIVLYLNQDTNTSSSSSNGYL